MSSIELSLSRCLFSFKESAQFFSRFGCRDIGDSFEEVIAVIVVKDVEDDGL